MQKFILTVDRGSTNLKLVLFDNQGQQVYMVSAANPPTISIQEGWREFDLNAAWQHLCVLSKQVFTEFCRPEQIAAVSFSGHGNGLILLDKDQQPLGNGIFSLDGRAASIIERWQQDGRYQEAQDVFRCPLIPGAAIPLFAWLKENQPELVANARHCIFAKDWLRLCLGGDVATDYTDASCGSLLDHAQQSYSADIYNRLGVDELFTILPPLHASTEQVAVVSKEAAEATGLCAGTPLFMGGQDVCMGPAGIGDLSAETLVCVFGSWSVSVLNVTDTDGLPLVINHPLKGHYLSGVGDGNAGIALDTMIRLWLSDVVRDCELNGENLHQTLENMVAATDQNSLLFIPHVFGNMLRPDAVSGLIGLRAQTERTEIFKAVCEGILLGYFANISLLPHFAGVSSVWLIGGGAKSDLLGQMMADIFNRQVQVAQDSEITARGAAVCTMMGLEKSTMPSAIPAPRVRKRFTPDPSMAEYYSKKAALISKVLLEGDPLLDAAAHL